jgi:hypothetical protein
MFLFAIMIILSAPSMCFYYSGNDTKIKDFNGLITAFSLGNLGAASNGCATGTYGAQTSSQANT